jgi:hypothetical protein
VNSQVLSDADPPHKDHVGMWDTGWLSPTVDGANLTLPGSYPWVEVSGTLHEDGTFWADGAGTVAGFPNIHVSCAGAFGIVATDTLTFTAVYTMGDQGGLPGGGSISLLVTGQQVDQDEGAGPVPAETAPEFTGIFVGAMQSGDTPWLFGRLHPAVLEWYGDDQCGSYLETVANPTFDIEILSQSGPEPWTYERDGLGRLIFEVYTVQINMSADGQTNPVAWHLVLGPDGRYQWFTDCGEPLPAE